MRVRLLFSLLLLSAPVIWCQTLYFKNTTSSVSGYSIIDEQVGAGSSATAATATLTASGTLIQAGGTLAWITPSIANPVTISSSITVNVWAKESATSSNAGISVRLFKYSGGSEAGSPFATCVYSTELTTTMAAKNYTCTPTSTSFATGDSIVAKAFFVNCATSGCPTGTMASGTGTFDYNRSTSADGQSYITLGDATTFQQTFSPTLSIDSTSATTVSLGTAPKSITASISEQADLTATFDLDSNLLTMTDSTNLSGLFGGTYSFSLTAPTATSATVQQAEGFAPVAQSTSTNLTVSTFSKSNSSYSFSPSVTVSEQADLTATFDLDLSSFTQSTSTAMTVRQSDNFNPTMPTSTSVSGVYTAKNFNFSPTVLITEEADLTATFDLLTALQGSVSIASTTDFDSANLTNGDVVNTNATVAFLKSAGIAPAASTSLNFIASFNLATQINAAPALTLAATPQFSTTQTSNPVAVATALGVNNSVGTTQSASVTTGATAGFAYNSGTSSYTFSPNMSVANSDVPTLQSSLNPSLSVANGGSVGINTAQSPDVPVSPNMTTGFHLTAQLRAPQESWTIGATATFILQQASQVSSPSVIWLQ